MERPISTVGVMAMVLLAYVMPYGRRRFPRREVFGAWGSDLFLLSIFSGPILAKSPSKGPAVKSPLSMISSNHQTPKLINQINHFFFFSFYLFFL
ncbi:MAG: hypothetical protein ACREOI_07305 [bacterium]